MYDGWNLIQETTTTDSGESTEYYAWGLDLSGSLQGAGGIGGLLVRNTDSGSFLYLYDANGNVGQLVDASTGSIAAHYEYDPFGNTIVANGSEAGSNPFRFSTKSLDTETGLSYYGYRYYSPELGRWTTRDPIKEFGFIVLQTLLYEPAKYAKDGINFTPLNSREYLFVSNNSVNVVDRLGLITLKYPRYGAKRFTIPLIDLPIIGLWVDLWIDYDCEYPGLNIQLQKEVVRGIPGSGFFVNGERRVEIIPGLLETEECCGGGSSKPRYVHTPRHLRYKGEFARLEIRIILYKSVTIGIPWGQGYSMPIYNLEPEELQSVTFECGGCASDFREKCCN